MVINEVIEKRRLIITLGAHEAPASWHWEAKRFLRNADGSDAAPPQKVVIEATADEVAAHLGAAVPKLRAAIAADTERYAAGLKALKDEHLAHKEAMKAALAQAHAERDAAQRERDALEVETLRPRRAN